MPVTRSVEDLTNIDSSDNGQNRGAVPRVQTRSVLRDLEQENDMNERINA